MNALANFWVQRTPAQRMMLLAAALLAAIMLGLWLARGMFSEEERVKGAVLELISACENRDVQRFSGQVSRDYRGSYMDNRDTLIPRVEHNFSRYSDLSVRVTKWDIVLEGDEAKVSIRFHFRMFVNSAGPYRNFPVNRLPSTPRGEDDKARLVMKNEAGQWKLLEAEFDAPE